MQQATIGSKYQIVLPKEVRKKIKGLRPGDKVTVRANKKVITVKPAVKNWADEHYGKYKKYLKGGVKEVEKMRDEWEERLKELGREYSSK